MRNHAAGILPVPTITASHRWQTVAQTPVALRSVRPPPTESMSAPPSLVTVADQVRARLGPLLDAERQRWETLDVSLAGPLDALADLVLSDAKRIRPAFCYWGHVAAGGDPDRPLVIDAGSALELLQAFALVHDDVMDGSSTRRGNRTAHLTFQAMHTGQQWRGESRRFGEGVAILIGDLAHVFADRLMSEAPSDARKIWDELRIELNVGQFLDLLGTAECDTDPVRARRIARYKSGRYTVERPLHLGAAIAGRLDDYHDLFSAFGDPLGEAFQLRDDLLGAFGETARTGKPVGDDLREGKPTTLLAEATARATPSQATALRQIGDPTLDSRAIAELQDVLIASGARSFVEARIDALTRQAIDALEAAPIPSEAHEALVSLAWFVARRDF